MWNDRIASCAHAVGLCAEIVVNVERREIKSLPKRAREQVTVSLGFDSELPQQTKLQTSSVQRGTFQRNCTQLVSNPEIMLIIVSILLGIRQGHVCEQNTGCRFRKRRERPRSCDMLTLISDGSGQFCVAEKVASYHSGRPWYRTEPYHNNQTSTEQKTNRPGTIVARDRRVIGITYAVGSNFFLC